MSDLRDPLQLPLDSIRVVEASAGTGKTFTIATLWLRLILECGLLPEQIVVATFTRAATAELSERLRARLLLADELLAQDDPAATHDDDAGDAQATRATIAKVLQGKDLAALRKHVRAARLAMDAAMIGTLHGFCHRVLDEFGFEAGQTLRRPQLIDDVRELELEIVRDFWRRGGGDAEIARRLTETWGSPEALVRQVCDARWRGREVRVPEPDLAGATAAFARALVVAGTWDERETEVFEGELQRCIKDTRARNNRIAAFHDLREWARTASPGDAIARFDAKATASLRVDVIENLKPEGARPQGRIFDGIAALLEAFSACQRAQAVAADLPVAHLLHDARAFLESELPKRLAARDLVSHDQAVDALATALRDDARGTALARIRERWHAALIDEFQDTDARQWEIVHRLFGGSTLVLVGDPKQSIYGFRGGDVYAWKQACGEAAAERLRLHESHRAGEGMMAAVNALFGAPDGFIEAGIDYADVASAQAVAPRALLRDGEPERALQLWRLPRKCNDKGEAIAHGKGEAWALIERACVAYIAALLADARTGRVCLRDKRGVAEPLHAKHIAVLVDSNRQAASMQVALARAGVPACSNLQASVYAGDEATELQWLLDALRDPAEPRRARAAMTSVLLGHDSAEIDRSVRDTDAQARMLETVASWAQEVERRGPLAWLHARIADAAPRLLALPDGERRVANWLQLAELLQAMHARSFGLDDLAQAFAQARAGAVDDADSARLRLDTDADAITVSTLHAAKGLEYEIVLLPCAALAHDPGKARSPVPLHWYHGDRDEAHVAIGNGVDKTVINRAGEEQRAEDVRKFYVGVTRACALCVLPWGWIRHFEHSAAHWLLHEAGNDAPFANDDAGCDRALEALCKHADGAAAVVPMPEEIAHALPAVETDPQSLRARNFTRTSLERDWRTWSFSRLVRGATPYAAADPASGSGDEAAVSVEIAATPAAPTLAGPRFGTAVHAALERTDFAAWRDARDIPPTERALLQRCLREQGLPEPGEVTPDHALAIVGECMRGALNVTLPCGVRPCDLGTEQRRAEMEFHLKLAPHRVDALFELMHAHGYQRGRSGFGMARLNGLLTGIIDLVFEHDGRYHLIDWKTNLLPDYGAASLQQAIAAHDYDLQWLLYMLALHRWLRQVLPGYEYEAHVGEAYYLFVRDLRDGGGLHRDRPPRALIEGMDALFDGMEPRA
ncbi:MAG TPA: UvrD-helicase domain-containing protein [Rhodanobacteraceae bacterium]|nr:UvrD-helicase domain-containing protein [Rhodanobacteraceae bacterium]